MLRKIYFGLFDMPHPSLNGRGHKVERDLLGNEKRGQCQSSLPAREQQGQAVDGRLTLHSIGLLGGQSQDLLLTAANDLLVRLHGHLQGHTQSLVEEIELLREGVLAQAVDQVCQLEQAGHCQQEVPDDNVQAAGIEPAPQHAAHVASAQEAKEIEASVYPTAPHEAQEQDTVSQVVESPFHILLPASAHRPLPETLAQCAGVGAHLRGVSKSCWALGLPHRKFRKRSSLSSYVPSHFWLLTTNSTCPRSNVSGSFGNEWQDITHFMEKFEPFYPLPQPGAGPPAGLWPASLAPDSLGWSSHLALSRKPKLSRAKDRTIGLKTSAVSDDKGATAGSLFSPE